MKRTPLQKKSGTLSRGTKILSKCHSTLKSGSKLKSRSKSSQQVQQQKDDIEKMIQLFTTHWEQKSTNGHVRYCQSCECRIYGENKNYYHDHLIEKSSHPKLKYEMGNLALVCLECHTKKTNGSPTERHRELIEAAKKRYNL